MKTFVCVLVLLCMPILCVHAGLDQHGLFDDVIAIYTFDTPPAAENSIENEAAAAERNPFEVDVAAIIAGNPFEAEAETRAHENTHDRGPRNFDGSLEDGASITDNGKFGKALRLPKDASFGSWNDLFLSVTGDFSIAGWVKINNPLAGDTSISLGVFSEEDNQRLSLISLSIYIDRISCLIADGGGTTLKIEGLIYENPAIDDGEWHHLVFSLSEDFYRLFIDGDIVEEKRNGGDVGFVGNDTFILISNRTDQTAVIDEVGFFETGFSPYEVRGLYADGLTTFLETMPVHPEGLATTTWGALKSGK